MEKTFKQLCCIFQKLALPLLVFVFILSSCKKESIVAPPPAPRPVPGPVNMAPIAVAGPDQTISLPTDSVELDGMNSRDPDGSINGYRWTQVWGPSAGIINPGSIRTIAGGLSSGVYLFELMVTDNKGLAAKDTVKVTVNPAVYNNPSPADIYIAGEGLNANGKTVARIWNNGVLQDLSNGRNDAGANAIAISGTDVYVAGYDGDYAVLWKNGTSLTLGTGKANSVFVAGTDVYVAGTSDPEAMLWKNAVPQVLGYGEASSVFVSSNDVYVTGRWEGKSAIWKNGVVQIIFGPEEDFFYPASIFVSNNNVYVAATMDMGGYGAGAFLLTNTTRDFYGPNDGFATSVFVNGNDVYVSGTALLNGRLCMDPIIWKNGQAISLKNAYQSTIANSVFVFNGSVYATGGKWDNPGNDSYLWVDGTEYSVGGLRRAKSVFVK